MGKIASLDEADIALSVITIGEIKFGIEKLQSQTKKEKLTQWLYNELFPRFDDRIISIDSDIMLRWGEVTQKLESIGRPMPIMDSLIAATAIEKNLILITRNEKDFVTLDMEIINPFIEK